MKAKTLALVAALGSAALLGGALFFQALGYAPCDLCLLQRWPHGAAIGIGVLALVLPTRWVALPGAAAALTTAAIGVYHSGVEQGIFEGPDTCTSNPIGALTTDDLMNQIMAAPLIRCDEIAWSFLGLSMASWNAILSLGLAAIWLAAFIRARA